MQYPKVPAEGEFNKLCDTDPAYECFNKRVVLQLPQRERNEATNVASEKRDYVFFVYTSLNPQIEHPSDQESKNTSPAAPTPTAPAKPSTFIYGLEDEYAAYYRQAKLGGSVYTKEEINKLYSYLNPVAKNLEE